MSSLSSAVERTITAQNQFTDSIQLKGPFNFSVSGSFSATVTIQRSFVAPEDTPVWQDVSTYTASREDIGISPDERIWWRAGVKTGQFTSGSVDVRISQ